MSTQEALQRIEEAIQRELPRIADSFVPNPASNIDSRLICLELTRALNFAWWRASITKSSADYTSSTTMARGFNTAMSIFMTEALESEGVPNAPSTRESQVWADAVLTKLGVLRLARRVVDLCRADLIEFVEGTASVLRFRTIRNVGLNEDADVDAQRWLSDLTISYDDPEYLDLQSSWAQIQSLLRANVRVYADYYIGYDSTPELDEYFQRLAILHTRRSHGHDAFRPDAQFGGLPYAAFAAATTALIGWSLKHLAFSTELVLMMPNLEIRNLLVPWSPVRSKVESLSWHLEVEEEEAAKILRLLTGSPAVAARYAPVHDAPIPTFIPAARNYIHFSAASAQLLPYDFLLRRLREVYEADYFRNVDHREAEFREDLRWVLPLKRTLFANSAVQLRDKGRLVTDIDALALSYETGTLGLFQLKWQDPFGNDLRERRSRLTNLVPSANCWIQAVLDWLELYGPNHLVSLAQMGKPVPSVHRVILFVVGRYHCNFSKAQTDSRAVWCTWPQLLRAVDETGLVNDPLVTLETAIKKQKQQARPRSGNGIAKLHLRDFTIETSYC